MDKKEKDTVKKKKPSLTPEELAKKASEKEMISDSDVKDLEPLHD